MGSCLGKLFDKKIQVRTSSPYFTSGSRINIEFENLIDEDDNVDRGRAVTREEIDALKQKRYSDLVQQQRTIDAELEAELQEQEEQLRIEEEAFYAAQREAARIAKQRKLLDQQQAAAKNGPKAWVGGDQDDWEVAGGEEDFEKFLESVKQRALSTRQSMEGGTEAPPGDEVTNENGDSTSLDLEWENEELGEMGEELLRRARSNTEVEILKLIVDDPDERRRLESNVSTEMEWDDDEFVSAETVVPSPVMEHVELAAEHTGKEARHAGKLQGEDGIGSDDNQDR
ncbi:AP-1 complex-associated regulatory protein-like isoform X2 [Branchiostoma floridae]|uniref:AP-1 complex-associated regulatory protein-like isoform X2 n=1 Tax=Branchiostoma floridae TaxID=7739 RepID=A0A9J7KTN8_BRAFL|nr:AP-1 complex-associated regulatory protein-like isoform X2 [Branchiostoma floridae]